MKLPDFRHWPTSRLKVLCEDYSGMLRRSAGLSRKDRLLYQQWLQAIKTELNRRETA
jgi:hypothetical protein